MQQNAQSVHVFGCDRGVKVFFFFSHMFVLMVCINISTLAQFCQSSKHLP